MKMVCYISTLASFCKIKTDKDVYVVLRSGAEGFGAGEGLLAAGEVGDDRR